MRADQVASAVSQLVRLVRRTVNDASPVRSARMRSSAIRAARRSGAISASCKRAVPDWVADRAMPSVTRGPVSASYVRAPIQGLPCWVGGMPEPLALQLQVGARGMTADAQ